MKRALITFLAVMSLSVSVAGSVATVSDAKSDNGNCSERGGTNNSNHNKPECEKKKDKCKDDDRGKTSTQKACKDDDHDNGHGNGGD